MRTEGISFIIPGRDRESVLPRAIGPALEAVDRLGGLGVPAEVIVVDDDSRDGSPVLLRQLEALYHGRGLRVLAFDRGAGPSSARDLALQRSRYRYAALLDADAEVIPGNVHHFLRSIRETGAAAVFGVLLGVGGDVEDAIGHESFDARMFERDGIGPCALYDVGQLVDAGAVRSGFDGAEQGWELNLRLAACGRRLVQIPMAFALGRRAAGRREAARDAAGDDEARRNRRGDRPHPMTRDAFPPRTLHLRHHPDLGYL